jgi:AcrR family transcriptional regulator
MAQPSQEDLTARARIRDAALEQFAEHGISGATIRGIAEAAGVSPGLVQHHFGSKAKLRQACDEYTIETYRRINREALDGGIRQPSFIAVAVKTAVPLQRYLARALVDGSPGAAELFDEAVEFTKDLLENGAPGMNKPTTDDLHAYAAVMVGMSFGLVVLHEHMSRALGGDTLGGDAYPRLAMASMDIMLDNLMTPELVEQARTALQRLQGGASP